MTDTPPAKPPSYFSGGWFRLGSDEPQFRVVDKFKFEFLSTDENDDPALAAAYYSKDFAEDIAREPLWLATGGWAIVPGAVGANGATHTVAFSARHAGSGRSVEGHISFSPDRSNWVKVEVFLGAFRVFLAYLDRVWEEYDLWPSGATGQGEEPGRIGKKRNWVNLKAEAWPAIRHASGEDYLNLELPDNQTVEIAEP